MVVKAFRDKCYPLGGEDLEWCIYHGLKWCLSLTKVLIIQSEEELPAHYLPENNNVNTSLPGLSQCSLSELVSCSTVHSISTSTMLQDSFPVLHYLSLPVSLTLPTLPRITSQCLAGCLPPSAPPHPLTSSLSARLCCSTPPPYLVLMSHCEIQADGWGTKGWEGGPLCLSP